MEIKKKVHEVKEKAKEFKDKIVEWKNDHVDEIICGVVTGVPLIIGGVIGYKYGDQNGYKRGYSKGLHFIPGQFGVNMDDLVTCRNLETGNLDYIMTKEFDDLMFKNSDIIHYEDGSFNFKSEEET